MSKQVEVIEVGPRDGFQSVKCTPITTEQKLTVIDQLVAAARAAGVKKIVGHYYPTAKNLLVKDFYATIGFVKTAGDEAGNAVFEFTDLAGYQPQCGVMEIEQV